MGLVLKILVILILVVSALAALALFIAHKPVPDRITYGMSFEASYAKELGLDWRETYIAILDELKVRHLRLSAHWDTTEPQKDSFDWSVSDFELAEAKKRGATVIFGVGRRLPRWPECHVPQWARSLSWEDQKKEIREYLEAAVTRYKDDPTIIYWQVENEPYLEVFAKEHCGEFDEAFLKEEVELVRSLDGTRPILVTDSGNLGTWRGAYSAGDVFGTSVYVYFWNPELGQFRTVLPPWFYRIKEGLVSLFYGKKPTMLIELSLEPWLVEPIANVPIETQYSRMDAAKFDEILAYAKATRFDTQYLWGAEWWFYLKEKGHREMWDKGKSLFGG